MITPKRTFWLATSSLRAIAEAALWFVAAVGLLTAAHTAASEARIALLLLVNPLCMLWYAVRARILHGSRVHWLWAEGLLSSLLSAVVVGLSLILLPGIHRTELDALGGLNVLPTAAIYAAEIWGGTVFLRCVTRVWVFWDRLRRQHLVWSLTHAHLSVVVLMLSLLVVAVAWRTAESAVQVTSTSAQMSGYDSSLLRALVSLVPWLGVSGVLMLVALVVLLPPFALFSYLFARRTVRRLESLTHATAQLCSGDYAARVEVRGEDEVARLQTDFNVMASRLEQTLQELGEERDKVAGLLNARRELIANVSHELRTPVATLRSYLEPMLARPEALPSGVCSDLRVVEQETVRLQALIDDLFSLARAEVGGLRVQCQPTDVADVMQHCVHVVAPLAWRSGKVEIVADLPAQPVWALVDPARLEQSLHNLLRNAVRHTPPGGIVVVSVCNEPNAVMLRVQDTGEGIAREDLPHIWERFYRGESARARDGSGAGLGLALVKELTEAMGGSVQVENAEGAGCRFTLRLVPAANVVAT